jgi:hypothetical protein
MKGLILFRGLTFREFDSKRRFAESLESYNNQISATLSHVKFVKHLKSQGHDIDVAFDTIQTQHTTDLTNLFEDNLKFCSLKNVMDVHTHYSLYRAVTNLEPVFYNVFYDFFVIVRNDMFLKDQFFEVFNPDDDKLKFMSITWYKHRKTPKNNPRVNDCMFFIPRQYFNIMRFLPTDPGSDHHDILDIWLKEFPKLEFDCYLKGYFDSNTKNDQNPLYKLVDRPEAQNQDSDPNLKFPDDF